MLFTILFVDDTNVFIERTKYENVMHNLNTELKYIDVWLAANELEINTSKTFYMVFHRATIKSNIAVVMNKEAHENFQILRNNRS